MNFLTAPAAAAPGGVPGPPSDHGRPGRRYVIRGGSVMTMDPKVKDLPQGDVLVEGTKIVDIGQTLRARRRCHRRQDAS
jgi:hypothetical protein